MPPIFTFKRGQSTPSGPNPGPGAIDAFKAFVEAEDFPEARSQFETLLVLLQLESGPFYQFYPKLKAALKEHVPFKYKEIFKIMDNKARLNWGKQALSIMPASIHICSSCICKLRK